MNCDWVKVEGESMRPVLRGGDWIGVEWHPPRITAGDLLLGRYGGNVWLVHRLVRTDGTGGIVLKGDASAETETLTLDEVWGKVVAIRREPRQPPSPLRTTWLDGWIAVLSRRKLRRMVFVLGWLRRASL